jgi:hypothetical protein
VRVVIQLLPACFYPLHGLGYAIGGPGKMIIRSASTHTQPWRRELLQTFGDLLFSQSFSAYWIRLQEA